jgi:hypothetical protein
MWYFLTYNINIYKELEVLETASYTAYLVFKSHSYKLL